MNNKLTKDQRIIISSTQQLMHCYEDNHLFKSYSVSTAKNGLGERVGSECTPRGWHRVYSIIGLDCLINSVFVARSWTGEYYSPALAAEFKARDWILTRIIQLDGLEPGFNSGGEVDTLSRFIYIHGTPDTTKLGRPGSHGCIRMNNLDVIELALWVNLNTHVCIE